MTDDPGAEPYGFEPDVDDYDVVHVSLNWGILSLVAFLIVVTFQVFDLGFLNVSLVHVMRITMVLTPVGFILGLIGMKFGDGRQIAKIGAFLNGVVLFCILVLLPLTSTVLRLIR